MEVFPFFSGERILGHFVLASLCSLKTNGEQKYSYDPGEDRLKEASPLSPSNGFILGLHLDGWSFEWISEEGEEEEEVEEEVGRGEKYFSGWVEKTICWHLVHFSGRLR